jgi:hypothetical protein
VVVLVLAEPLAEEESAGDGRHCGKDAAMQFVQDVVHFEGLDRCRKFAEQSDSVGNVQVGRE